MAELISKSRIEELIKEYMGLDVSLKPIPDKQFSNVADYKASLPLPEYLALMMKPRLYARTRDGEVTVYLTFDNKVRANNYDGGFYGCDGRHYVVLFARKEVEVG